MRSSGAALAACALVLVVGAACANPFAPTRAERRQAREERKDKVEAPPHDAPPAAPGSTIWPDVPPDPYHMPDRDSPDGPAPDEQVDGPDRGLPIPSPAPFQRVQPLFVRPFAGDYPTTGFLDHHRKGKAQTTPWGATTWGRPGHNGHDFALPVGTPLYAMADGEVITAGPFGPPCDGQANVVQVLHRGLMDGRDFRTGYWHLKDVTVKEGDRIAAGTLVGHSGNTGCSTGPHLHFGVIRIGDQANPRDILVDPYGWAGEGTDPLALGPDSAWMWKEGQAPALFRGASRPDRSSETAQLLRVVGTVWRDDPAGEYVEVGVIGKKAPESVDLGGWSIGDAEGQVTWTFPPGTVAKRGAPVRVSSGPGGDGVVGMGRATNAWDTDGDCVLLKDPSGAEIDRLDFGGKSCP